jgi:predicted CxxxxCH...CXXCH cytochrome family protein
MRRALLLLAWAGLATTACQRTLFEDGLPTSLDCSGCHGENGDPTPPRAVNGATSRSDVGVGAHQAHMRGSSLAGPVACSECHVLPAVADGTEHPDPLGKPARVLFGPLAAQAPASPVWDRNARTCAGTYCHGATLRAAATRPAPSWIRADSGPLPCDACHGFPPPPTHPEGLDCERCHGAVVAAGGVILDPSLHVNGIVDFGP